jgi:hypothetical protein
LEALVSDLLDTVRLPGRAGLAANQMGVALAAFSYDVDDRFGYVLNPSLVETEWPVACNTRPTTYAASSTSTRSPGSVDATPCGCCDAPPPERVPPSPANRDRLRVVVIVRRCDDAWASQWGEGDGPWPRWALL